MSEKTSVSIDVIVVGSGPTGLTLANLLAKMDARVCLIEKNEKTVSEPRAVSIDDEALRVYQSIGLKDKLSKNIIEGYGSIYKDSSGKEFSRVMPNTREYGFEKRNAFQQPTLEKILYENFLQFSNSKSFFNWKMLNFIQTNSGVKATITCQKTGKQKIIEGKFLVGCDGASSLTRKTLKIPLEGASFKETWVIVDLIKTINRNRHTEVFCNPDRPCITLPGPGQTRRYEFMMKANENEDNMLFEQNVRSLLASVGPDAHQGIRRIRAYTFHARVAKTWREKRIFLAGDAAHLSPPFAGQGMNSGVRDAANLAWKLSVGLDKNDSEEVLDSYEKERKPHAWDMINLALRMGKIMNPRSHFRAFMLKNVFRTLRLFGPAKDYVSQMKYKPKPSFSSGMIWPDGKKETIVGKLIPQPITEDPKKRDILLDEYFLNKECLLIFDEQPDKFLSKRVIDTFLEKECAVIGLTPEWSNSYRSHIQIVRDKSKFFSSSPYCSYIGSAMLIRKDKYVAAVTPIDKIGKLYDYLCELTN